MSSSACLPARNYELPVIRRVFFRQGGMCHFGSQKRSVHGVFDARTVVVGRVTCVTLERCGGAASGSFHQVELLWQFGAQFVTEIGVNMEEHHAGGGFGLVFPRMVSAVLHGHIAGVKCDGAVGEVKHDFSFDHYGVIQRFGSVHHRFFAPHAGGIQRDLADQMASGRHDGEGAGVGFCRGAGGEGGDGFRRAPHLGEFGADILARHRVVLRRGAVGQNNGIACFVMARNHAPSLWRHLASLQVTDWVQGRDSRKACNQIRVAAGKAGLSLADKFSPQDEAFDAGVSAVNFLIIAGKADRFDQCALLQCLASTLDGEVFDQRYLIAIGQQIAHRIAHFDGVFCSLFGGQLGSGHPFAACFIIDVIFVITHQWGFLMTIYVVLPGNIPAGTAAYKLAISLVHLRHV